MNKISSIRICPSLWSLTGLLLIINISVCWSGAEQATPLILTSSQSFRVAVGDSVLLPCSVQDLGSLVVMWKRQQEVLTAGKLMVNPDVNRFQLVDGYNLEIRNIGATDAGDYTCHITTFKQPVTISHTLEILVPPSVKADPADGNYVVKKGRRVELNCEASGNPKPDIYWSREGDVLPSGEGSEMGKSLVIESVDRHESGLYQCKATNGVGTPAMANFNLQVLYPPEIDLETDRVHSGENKEAHLTCLIHGNPTPTVRWYKDSSLLSETNLVRMKSSNNRHTLVISGIRSGQDFGNYSCVAENSLGTFKKHIEIHGRPTPAIFRSQPNTNQDQIYELIWSVDSYSPIQEYRLLYRKIKPYLEAQNSALLLGGGDWTNVIIPGDLSSPGFHHRKTYLITQLFPDSEYECLVQARNRFGWSEASRLFRFYTSRREPRADEMEWKTVSSCSCRSSDTFGLISTLVYSIAVKLFIKSAKL